MTYSEAFGAVLRRLRVENGLIQEDFQGVATDRYIRNLEKGKASPSLDTMMSLCALLKVSPITFVGLIVAECTGQDPHDLMKEAIGEMLAVKPENAQ